jgi:hypothetical protein
MPTTVRFLGPDSVKVDSKEKVPADVKGTKIKETKIKETKIKGKKVNPKDDAKDKVKKPVKTGGKMKKT